MKHLITPGGWVLAKDIFGFYEENGKVYVNYRDPKDPFGGDEAAELTYWITGVVDKKKLEDWLKHSHIHPLTVS